MTNLRTRVPKSAQPRVATMVRTIHQQPCAAEMHSQLGRVVDQLNDWFPKTSSILAEAGPGIPAFTSFPNAHRKQVWSNNPLERLNKQLSYRNLLRQGFLPL